MSYETYSEFLGIPYIEGENDCYGLAQKYYRKIAELEFRDYARPSDFAYSGLDLITENFLHEGFEVIDVSLNRLQIGDGLLMRLGDAPLINHVAVYVGNGHILHHLYNQLSSETSFTKAWQKRVAMVVRHPDVKQNVHVEKINFIDLLPKNALSQNPS